MSLILRLLVVTANTMDRQYLSPYNTSHRRISSCSTGSSSSAAQSSVSGSSDEVFIRQTSAPGYRPPSAIHDNLGYTHDEFYSQPPDRNIRAPSPQATNRYNSSTYHQSLPKLAVEVPCPHKVNLALGGTASKCNCRKNQDLQTRAAQNKVPQSSNQTQIIMQNDPVNSMV